MTLFCWEFAISHSFNLKHYNSNSSKRPKKIANRSYMKKGQKRLSKRALLGIALLVMLGFTLGCSEFIVIGIEPELARDFDVSLARVGPESALPGRGC